MIWLLGVLAFLLLWGSTALESRKREYSQGNALAWTVGLFIVAVLILVYVVPILPK